MHIYIVLIGAYRGKWLRLRVDLKNNILHLTVEFLKLFDICSLRKSIQLFWFSTPRYQILIDDPFFIRNHNENLNSMLRHEIALR